MALLYELPLLFGRVGPGWGYGDGPGGWPWIFGPLMLLLWVGLIAGVVWLIMRNFRPRERTSAERARDILAERYARGEISSEEFRERLEQLR